MPVDLGALKCPADYRPGYLHNVSGIVNLQLQAVGIGVRFQVGGQRRKPSARCPAEREDGLDARWGYSLTATPLKQATLTGTKPGDATIAPLRHNGLG